MRGFDSIFLCIFLIIFQTVSSLKGEIRSCRGWKLNRLPEVKAFLKEGHVDEYQDVSVTWIPGHTPELHILNDEGELTEKVVLKDYTTDGLHSLMEEKGFKKKVSE